MFVSLQGMSSRISSARRMMTVGISVAAMAILPANVRAQSWYGTLMGANEVPPNASSATGFTSLSLSGNFLSVSLNWSGLTGGPAVAGHIHCCVAPGSNVGVALGFTGLPGTATGSYMKMFDLNDMSVYTSAFVTNFGGGTAAGSQAALVAGLNSGMSYVNLHNAQFPGGEIRANVVVTPEPASVAMLALGLFAVGFATRRKARDHQ